MPSPTLLGERYQLGELLGRGGMAEVFRAVDTKLHRYVAVKLLHDGAEDSSDRARFIAEARTLAMLSHSGLVTVFDAGFGGSRPFLVMELVEGPTLAQQIARGPLSPEDVASVALQVAEALSYVHGRGIIHRDIKPANVLGQGHGVKLADFGIARLVEQGTRHTRTGHAIGTAAYLAPEQVRGAAVTAAADVYSLGLVLLEALTGQREYPGPAAEAAVARLTREPVVPDHLPRPWPSLLGSMTRSDPALRPTAADVAATMRAASSAPVPDPVVGVPDAITAPIIATEPEPGPETGPPTEPRPGTTRPVTGPAPVGPPPPAQDRARAGGEPVTEEWALRAQRIAKRLRETPPHVRGIAGGLAVICLLLIVVALGGRTTTSPDIPDNTPAQLREPLEDLHVAVEGEGE